MNGKPVDALAFDGSKKAPDGSYYVAVWRSVLIDAGTNKLTAKVSDANGQLVETVDHQVYFALPPINAQLVKERSALIADGVTRPRIAGSVVICTVLIAVVVKVCTEPPTRIRARPNSQ